MDQLLWDEVAQQFEDDGSLRDIYVRDTTMLHWQQVIDGLSAAGYALEYSLDNQACDLPRDVADVFEVRDDHNCLLSVRFNGVVANCHFFIVEEIDFDIDPCEIRGQQDLDALMAFLYCLARSTQNDVLLTPEGLAERVIIRIRYDDSTGHHVALTD